MTKNKGKNLHACKAVLVTLTLVTLSLSAIAGTESEIDDKQMITVAYSFDAPFVEKFSIDDNVYDKVVLPGVPSIADPGEPCLPIKGAYILIPKNTQVSKIDVTPTNKVYIGSGFNIEPSGKPVPLSMANLAKSPEPDPSIYDSNDPFPSTLFTEVGTYGYSGYNVLVLSLYPVQYIPIKGELYYFNNITVSVELAKDNNANTLFRGLMKNELEITKKVDNPAIVETYIEETTMLPTLNSYDLLIITTDELRNSFEPLKNVHEADGIFTEIKTLEDISMVPDSVNAEDIRDFIRNEYINNGIEYVLIGGDTDVVPAKRLWVYGLDEDVDPYTTYMPSDLYYACLDGPYNYDDDEKWGEPTDGEDGGDVDLLAEVYVGRACVGSVAEVENFVDKTISYIQANDDEYIKDFLLAGESLGDYGVSSWGGNHLDQLIDESTDDGYITVGIPTSGFNVNKLYDRDETWRKSEIIDLINNNIHVINHDGHASYNYNMRMENEDVINELNNDKYCFIYSHGCNSGGFDRGDCIAEYFTVKSEHGAFAGIWNARYGWFWSYRTDGDSQRFNREFWDAVFGENLPTISKANQDSKEDNLYLIGRSCMRWTYYELNLFGDPVIAFHISNPPDRPTIPLGPATGTKDTEYSYTASTTDIDGDQVYYLWDWGDGTDSGWLGPYNSGETCNASHTWIEEGTYQIKVKAKDEYGIQSGWSDLISVSMPKNKSIPSSFHPLLEKFISQFPLLDQYLRSFFYI